MNKKLIFWGATLFIIFAFLYSISEILFPFIFGMLVAYFFDPVVLKLEKSGMNRALASGAIILTFTAILIAFIAITTPILAAQSREFVNTLPEYFEKLEDEIIPNIENWAYDIAPEITVQAKEEAEKQAELSNVQEQIGKFLGGLLSSSSWLFNLLSLIFITPIVSFYILRDWGNFTKEVDDLLPRQYEKTIKEQVSKIDHTVSAFLRGQLNVCLILGTYYAIALTLAGLNFGLLIGFFAGLFCFVPFVGAIVGTLIGLSVAFFQFDDDITRIIIIGVIFAIGQVVEGNILTPKIVGDKIGVHPAWLIFGMLAGGSLLGLTGVILSVPLTAIINVLIQFAIEQYEKSEYYGETNKTAKKKKKAK